ncbi:MAG TPA: GIY-YIG nuclease family protein [Elusimicrobiota bacterium]|nr:GIY-YIG nuclease family protein [Elusimicrobiota bacterium]
MISILAQTGLAPEEPRDWNVYIARCADQTLYTGIAKDVAKRIAQHNAGRGAAYTRTRRPVTMVYAAQGFTRSGALVEEARIKALPRDEKKRLARDARRANRGAI